MGTPWCEPESPLNPSAHRDYFKNFGILETINDEEEKDGVEAVRGTDLLIKQLLIYRRVIKEET